MGTSVSRVILRAHPALGVLAAARALTALGNGITLVALVLLASEQGPYAVAGLLIAGTVPRLAGPLAGAVADRVSPRSVLIGCQIAAGACIAAVALLRPPLLGLCLLVAASALLDAVFAPAARASVVDIVPADLLGAANAWLTGGSTATMLAGSGVAGVLVASVGVGPALLVDAASFGLAAIVLLRFPRLAPRSLRGESVRAATAAGFRHARADAAVRGLAVGTFLLVAFLGVDNVALVFLIRDDLGGTGASYGVAQAVYGAGLLGGSVALARLHVSATRALAVGAVLSAAGTIGTGLAAGIGAAVAGQLVAGVGNALSVIGSDTLVQQIVPRPLLARVGGVVGTTAQIGLLTAYLASAPLIALVGTRGVFVVAGIGSLTALIVLRTPLRRGPV